MKKLLSALSRTVAYAMLIAAFAVSVAQTAHADHDHGDYDRDHDRGWHRGWQRRDWDHRHWYPEPRPVYAPPPVVYAPPPPVSTGLNLIVPLNFN